MAAATLTYDSIPARSETPISMTSVSDGAASPAPTSASFFSSQSLLSSIRYLYCRDRPLTSSEQRDAALNLSLYTNVAILITKAVAFFLSGSLSVLAALMDSALDILSQIVLYWAERRSHTGASSGLYPAGASKFEPVGVIICAALMGMGSFQVIREAVESLIHSLTSSEHPQLDNSSTGMFSIIAVILVKLLLFLYCKAVANLLSADGGGDSVATIEAMYQDHVNDCLSNSVAVVAVFFASRWPELWWLDPAGAIIISVYIMYSWYHTGSEEIEKLVGKAADQELIDRLTEIGNAHHELLKVDILRCYHFGEQFLVEMEVVLPPEMVLRETHDIGMSLQYKLEKIPEVERAFVHIDYKARAYDEHVNSKIYKSYQQQKSVDEEVERTQSPSSEVSSNSAGFEIL
jgi:cation diffusion facilitator family transporter